MQVGGLLDEKGYGIAMKKGGFSNNQLLKVLIDLELSDAEYRNALSEGILRLQESGTLASLKNKWWKEKKGGGACAVIFFVTEFIEEYKCWKGKWSNIDEKLQLLGASYVLRRLTLGAIC